MNDNTQVPKFDFDPRLCDCGGAVTARQAESIDRAREDLMAAVLSLRSAEARLQDVLDQMSAAPDISHPVTRLRGHVYFGLAWSNDAVKRCVPQAFV